MLCDETGELLGPALDGELDAAHVAQLERHLATCPACAAERQRLQALRSAVRSATYHRLAPRGRAAILAALGAPRPGQGRGRRPRCRGEPPWLRLWRWAWG